MKKTMYIKTSDGLLGPKGEYIEVYGKDLQTGGKRYEKIVAKKPPLSLALALHSGILRSSSALLHVPRMVSS
jgi:hypothetical protein